MRILHILDHSIPLHSGYSFRTQSILNYQKQMGLEVFCLTSPKHTATNGDRETIDNLQFFRTKAVASHLDAIPGMPECHLLLSLRRRILEVAREVQPDIIHAHSPVLNALPALSAGRILGLPVVYEVRALWEDAAVSHGTTRAGSLRYRLSRRLETHALRRTTAVTTICQGLKDEMLRRHLELGKIFVIPNGVDLEHFSEQAACSSSSLADTLGLTGKVIFGFVGSFYKYEGLDLLITGAQKLTDKVKDCIIVLVGGGQEEDHLAQLVERRHLSRSVLLLGRVPHQQVRDYYDLIDVLVYPRLSSRITELVTPLKPLEAMALGKIVVASDVGGHRELIRDGETGFLFRADDIKDMVDVLARVVAERDHWPRIIAQARNFVETERSWQSIVSGYRAVYQYSLAHIL